MTDAEAIEFIKEFPQEQHRALLAVESAAREVMLGASVSRLGHSLSQLDDLKRQLNEIGNEKVHLIKCALEEIYDEYKHLAAGVGAPESLELEAWTGV